MEFEAAGGGSNRLTDDLDYEAGPQSASAMAKSARYSGSLDRVWRQRRARRRRRMTWAAGGDGMMVAMASLSANGTRRASWYRGYRAGYRIGLKARGVGLRIRIEAWGIPERKFWVDVFVW